MLCLVFFAASLVLTLSKFSFAVPSLTDLADNFVFWIVKMSISSSCGGSFPRIIIVVYLHDTVTKWKIICSDNFMRFLP